MKPNFLTLTDDQKRETFWRAVGVEPETKDARHGGPSIDGLPDSYAVYTPITLDALFEWCKGKVRIQITELMWGNGWHVSIIAIDSNDRTISQRKDLKESIMLAILRFKGVEV